MTVLDTSTPLLLRVEDAAKLLNVSRNRMFDLIRQRQVASVKIGGSRRIPVRALAAYLDQLEADGAFDV